MVKSTKKIPFDFILDELFSLDPVVKPMFGCHAIYVGEKIMLIVRDKAGVHEESNGVWIATSFEHHPSLKKEFQSLLPVSILTVQGRETAWQMLHKDDDNFETHVLKICNYIKKRDERFGKIPKKKKIKS
jgi:hypothetical protein